MKKFAVFTLLADSSQVVVNLDHVIRIEEVAGAAVLYVDLIDSTDVQVKIEIEQTLSQVIEYFQNDMAESVSIGPAAP